MAPVEEDVSPPGQPANSLAALEAAVRLAEGSKDEERFLGVVLALRQSELLTHAESAVPLRKRLLAALGAPFLNRMLASPSSHRRVALAALRTLTVDTSAALSLRECSGPVADVWVNAAKSLCASDQAVSAGEKKLSADTATASSQEVDGGEEVEAEEAVEVLRQLCRFLIPKPKEAVATLGAPVSQALSVITEQLKLESPVVALSSTLALVQELTAVGAAGKAVDRLLEAICLSQTLRGSNDRAFALDLLSERAETGVLTSSEGISDILTEAITAASTGKLEPSDCAAILRMAAAALHSRGLALFSSRDGSGQLELKKLKALLRLAAGQLRLGLENIVPLEPFCAACMLIEAASATLASEAEQLEEAGGLDVVEKCLQRLHLAVKDAHEFCEEVEMSSDVCPPQLPLLARVIGIWQLEDPMRYATEFRRSLTPLCHFLAPSEFEVLIPGVHGLQDWHLTPAFAKVLEVLAWSLEGQGSCPRAFRPCALMLTEVALDAAAYLPEAGVPGSPDVRIELLAQARGTQLSPTLVDSWPRGIPRPPQAMDPSHEGARRLYRWSRFLWSRAVGTGTDRPTLSAAERGALATLCAALLVSVPEELVSAEGGVESSLWRCVAEHLLGIGLGPSEEEAATWRLSLRLCGFALDRHRQLADALAISASERRSQKQTWRPRLDLPRGDAGDDEDVDEWRMVDEAVGSHLRRFFTAVSSISISVP